MKRQKRIFKKKKRERAGIDGIRDKLPDILSTMNPFLETKVKPNNVLSIEFKSLLHTRKKIYSGSQWVAPVEKGDFEIKVSVICVEYRKMDEFIIPVSIIESNEKLV